MNEKEKKRISKLMSLVLRHKPETIQVELDENGWLSVDELIKGINGNGLSLDRSILDEVVGSNDKQRFVLSDDRTRIRANQGHSIAIDLGLKPIQPPQFLYHGTVEKFLNSIQTEGLKKMNRNHVHLSHEKATAINVGGRRGEPIVLVVKSGEMFDNGIVFYQSENGVWLTDHVDPGYIELK